MIYRNTLKAIVLATTCLAPFYAFAQNAGGAAGGAQYVNGGAQNNEGEVGFGLMGVTGKNPDQAGRYNGLTTNGVDAIGQFDLRGYPLWDSNKSTWHYDFTGDNLVFQSGTHLGSGVGSAVAGGDATYNSLTHNNLGNSSELNLNFGQQGTWAGGVYYDAISYTGNVIDSLYTVNGNRATLNNGLTQWGGVASGGPATTLIKTYYTVPVLMGTGAFQPVQVGTRRDIFGGNFKYLSGVWTFSGALRHEHKEGSMEESFDGPWGGTAFALPIDYDTDRYDLAAAYTTRLNQASLQYTFSHFHDNNLFVNIPYPFSNTGAPYQESAAYSTPPSNSAHYLTLMTATNMVPNTRINANLRVGLEMQSDTFAPDTADPNPPIGNLNSALQGTTNSNLNAMATVFQGKVSADSNPIVNTDARVYYGFDGRQVGLNQNQVFTGGTGGASDTSFTNPQYVVPQNWLKQNAGAELGYRLIPQYNTKLTVGYRFDVTDRNNAQVTNSKTNTGTVSLSSAIGPQVNSSLSYVHADRSGNINYAMAWNNLAGSYAGPTYSGAYYQAPMQSDAIKIRGDYTPMQNLSGGLFLQFKNENYSYPAGAPFNAAIPFAGVATGVKQDYNLTVGPDINYRPREDVNVHFFYTYERIFFNNLGNGACAVSNTGLCAGSAGYYQNKYTSAVHTGGVSSDWKVTDKLKLGAEYNVAYGSVMFGEYNGVFVGTVAQTYQNVSNYPDINSLMNNLKLKATYELKPDMDLVLQGTWTYFHSNDWNYTASTAQSAGATPATISFLTPGYASPNYSIVTLMTGIKYKF